MYDAIMYDATNFIITENNGLRLIVPSRLNAVSNAAWTSDNLWLRSRVETQDGKTVSQGFGKFFNLGSGPPGLSVSAADIAHAIQNGDALATLKLDGSLLIRSVYENEIMLRTRGSFGYDTLNNAWEIDTLFHEQYKHLWYKELFPWLSLLFEWTTPNNQIVIKYREPSLTLVGAVDHRTMLYLTIDELRTVADAMCTPLVRHWYLDSQGFESLMSTLTTEQHIEGYVVRLNGEQTLVKIKCEPYLTKHRLKSNMSSDRLADLWLSQGQPDFVAFIKYFETEYDEELASWMLPVASKLFDGVHIMHEIVKVIEQKVKGAHSKGMSRKDFALDMQAQYGSTKKFALAMSVFSGIQTGERYKTLLKGILLQNTRQMEIGMFKNLEDEVN